MWGVKISKLILIGMFVAPFTVLHAKESAIWNLSDDMTYIEKFQLGFQGYNIYSDMTPLTFLEIAEADHGLQEEIENDYIEYLKQKPEDTDTTPTPPAGYCSARSNEIPKGQIYPFGNPTVNETNSKAIGSGFGPRPMVSRETGEKVPDMHYGIDITGKSGALLGTPIYATADGVVEFVRTGWTGTEPNFIAAGNYVKIKHQNGFITYYMHMDKVFVKTGQNIEAGCQIGTMGYTGGSKTTREPLRLSDTHLHYQIEYTGSDDRLVIENHEGSGHLFIIPLKKEKKGNTTFIDPRSFFLKQGYTW